MDLPSDDESEGESSRGVVFEDGDGEIDYEQTSEEEDEESEDEDSEDSEEDSDASSDSGSGHSITFDDHHASSTKTSKKRKSGEDAEPIIDLPEDLQDELPSRRKGGVWTDPADQAIRVDLEANRMLKKLGRGKGDPKISGVELEKRLREQ